MSQKWVIVTGEMGTQVRWGQGVCELGWGRGEVRGGQGDGEVGNPGELKQETAGPCMGGPQDTAWSPCYT